MDAVAGASYCIGIAQVSLHELNAIEKSGEIFFPPRFEIIEAANRVSAFCKCLGYPGAKKSGAAGH
jgi:hypothetical protein